ncbi:hypothetical protein Glove_335g52 [Diversispora epigaea]|uniref:Uncharacterized protein n=1 Tax=Diversispora epigaea TaxID=1348612 RepID=A0A397HNI2_9GLOM|nr:hypothetical protein Glove_335g52 [Diversispora epigaea]
MVKLYVLPKSQIIWDLGCQNAQITSIWDLGFGIWNLEFRHLGFRHLDFEFERMSAKLTTMCYVHDCTEKITLEFIIREITVISKVSTTDLTKIIYLRVKAFVFINPEVDTSIEEVENGNVIRLVGKFVTCENCIWDFGIWILNLGGRMSAKLTTMCYVHDCTEKITLEFIIREITVISKVSTTDLTKIIYLRVKAFVFINPEVDTSIEEVENGNVIRLVTAISIKVFEEIIFETIPLIGISIIATRTTIQTVQNENGYSILEFEIEESTTAILVGTINYVLSVCNPLTTEEASSSKFVLNLEDISLIINNHTTVNNQVTNIEHTIFENTKVYTVDDEKYISLLTSRQHSLENLELDLEDEEENTTSVLETTASRLCKFATTI